MKAINPNHNHSDMRHDAVVKALDDCVAACEACTAGCLREGDSSVFSSCIRLARDCALLCAHASGLLMRDSEMARPFLLICAEACKKTAAESGRFYNAHCQICATHCSVAETACRALHEDSL